MKLDIRRIVLEAHHVADLAFSPMAEVVLDWIELVFLMVVSEFLEAFLDLRENLTGSSACEHR